MSAQEAAFARCLAHTNQYFLVRAGESEYESIGVINPVAKTSVDNGLLEKGKKQAVRSAFDLNEVGACDKNCWIWPSITQRAYPAAEIIAAVNGVSRRCAEYSFLDALGLGAHEGKNLEAVSEVHASDTLSPNESVSDVLVRVMQLISILKTLYSEDTDHCLTTLGQFDRPASWHRELSFAPEVRYVDTNTVPTYKQPASAVYKCLKPPNCN